MVSSIREFNYSKNGEVNSRRVLVIKEDEKAIAGYDLQYLSDTDAKDVSEFFKSHEVSDFTVKSDAVIKDDEVAAKFRTWNKAWRRFNKSSFVD